MKQIQSAEFRKAFPTEPVEVLKYKTVLGTWYPAGSEPFEEAPVTTDVVIGYRTEIEALQAEVKQLKRVLADRKELEHRPTGFDATIAPGFGKSRPAPKPGKKS